MNKRDLLALYLSGTYCHKTGTRPPSCATPPQPTIYLIMFVNLNLNFILHFLNLAQDIDSCHLSNKSAVSFSNEVAVDSLNVFNVNLKIDAIILSTV